MIEPCRTLQATVDASGELDLLSAFDAPRRRSGALVVMLVVGVAASTLVSMRLMSSPGPVGRPIEIVIPQPSAPPDDDPIGRILRPPAAQVPIDRDPFEPVDSGPKPPLPGSGRLQRAADTLVLSGLVGGSLANISGRILRVGGEVTVEDASFRVTDIGTDSVRLEAEGADPPFQTTLTMKR